jgi:hypothetical protein
LRTSAHQVQINQRAPNSFLGRRCGGHRGPPARGQAFSAKEQKPWRAATPALTNDTNPSRNIRGRVAVRRVCTAPPASRPLRAREAGSFPSVAYHASREDRALRVSECKVPRPRVHPRHLELGRDMTERGTEHAALALAPLPDRRDHHPVDPRRVRTRSTARQSLEVGGRDVAAADDADADDADADWRARGTGRAVTVWWNGCCFPTGRGWSVFGA